MLRIQRLGPVYFDGQKTDYFIGDAGTLYDSRYKPVRTFVDSRGYEFAPIYVNGERHIVHIHRCVACAFCEKQYPEYTDVDHVDADKLNNDFRNLEFVTPAENHRRAAEKGLYPHGEDHHSNKYTKEQIIRVCELLEDPSNTYVMIESLTGVHRDTVFRVYTKKKWRHISSKYDFSRRMGNEKIPSDIIHSICREFDHNPNANAYELARKYGVNKNQVYAIKYHKSYRKYSSKYNF